MSITFPAEEDRIQNFPRSRIHRRNDLRGLELELAGPTGPKKRREGQDTQAEVLKRNLREELEEREGKHFSSKDKSYNDDRDCRKGNHLLLEGSRRDTKDRSVPRSVDSDDSDVEVRSDDESDDDDEDEDDTLALMAELVQIRKERTD